MGWLCQTLIFMAVWCFVVHNGFTTPVTDNILITTPPTAKPPSKHEDSNCGYESCTKAKPGKLNVHLVPHTHNDVGWLKTVDQYYYGSKSSIQKAGVQYIIDSVLTELHHDPEKRFIYVETAFWWKWWMNQHDTIRHQVKKLVNNGQLEFISGGWSMNDEAVTNYQSIIDQLTWGFRKLNDTFGKCGQPHIGWQIDPFGHSREMASIFARMGFDGLFLGRLDYQDKMARFLTKTAEMVWQGSENLGKAAQLFTSVLYNNYAPPPGFCFDVLCDDEPFIDDKHSPDYNVDTLVSRFVDYVETQAIFYSTNNILLTMGGDFTYQEAHMWYKNLDKLIRYVNAQQSNNSTVNVFYSTPSCYVKAVHDVGQTWTTKQDDFFPYASDPHTYWTGFYTSRPTLKRFERVGNNFLQICKQLYSLTDLGPEDSVDLNKMREAMGIMQHHDAVTGTERQKVASDYARVLFEGFEECGIIAQAAINKLIANKKQSEVSRVDAVPIKSCLLLNISQCDILDYSNQFVVTVYNPLSHRVSHYVRVPVSGASYTVQDPTGKQLKIQLVPIPQPVIEIPGRVSPATMELVFYAKDLPPLGFRSYYISGSNHIHHTSKYKIHPGRDVILGNTKFNAVLDWETGSLKSMVLDRTKFSVSQDFYYYKGYIGDNKEFVNRSSGAYIFRPNGSEALSVSSTKKSSTYKGDLVDETHIKWSDWLSQVVRYYKEDTYHVEMEWLAGPIPVDDNVGKEIISRFKSDLLSDGLFYTDSNGREMLERKRNFRPTWSVNIKEPVSANYYPVTSRITLRDGDKEFSILTDRAQGGTSLNNGEVELMVHRRLLHDDAFGVSEALNETAFGHGLVAIGKHWLTGGNISSGTAAQRTRSLQQQVLLSPWLFFTPADNISFTEWVSHYKMEFSGLNQELPENVHILTLEPWKAHSFLLRLEHIYERNEHPVFSKPATVNLKNLFKPFSIVMARETTLGGNQWLSESHRFKWQSENDINFTLEDDEDSSKEDKDALTITLGPMQIRTFIIEVNFLQ
ncbi:lysosomal alpha-mannosidase isoform X2 [Zootermopsis nevadensis]|uniref:Alpha-mannosidase n=1 Tax=Zootermopsis nevadensis TaxID=136037 RepID=A0A067R124_ZOONE|nr:lysosomal alpha-mannosidase isoform X2 [Zootermopsis nevadensis]KDR11229.1 Lysosomal alpha-mannosidase [Zootermopsis nevadensis]